MPRIKLQLRDKYHFSTEIPIRISDINYGGHVGNESILTIRHEARVQLFQKYGYTELDVEGLGVIMADATIQYKSPVLYGDVLQIEIGVHDFTRYGCTLNYQMISTRSGKVVALAKTTISFYNDKKSKVANVPEKFRSIFS